MPTRTAHDVSHFRHCGRLKSAATNQGDMYLTGDVVAGSGSKKIWTGNLSVQPLTDTGTILGSGFNQAFWLYSDKGAADDPQNPTWGGETYLASANELVTEGSPTNALFYHNVYSTMTSGARAYLRLASNQYGSAEAFNAVGNSDDTFTLYAQNSDLCLTAGSSASDTLASQNEPLYMLTDAGRKNQRWTLEGIRQLTGIYQIAPALASDFAIASPGQSDGNQATLGIQAYDNRDITATWISEFRAEAGHTSPLVVSPLYYESSDKDHRVWMWCERDAAALPQPITQYWSTSLLSSGRAPSLLWDRDAGELITPEGTFYGAQIYLDYNTPLSSYVVLSSKHGDQQVDSLVWGDSVSSSTYSANWSQYWYRLPQNLYDSSLPQPYDLQLWVRDMTDDPSTARRLESLDQIHPSHHIVIEPRFMCDAAAYVVTMRVSSVSDTGSWERVISPTNAARWTGLGAAPFATPGVGEAWSPNAFVDYVDVDGYVHLGANFDFSSGVWGTLGLSGPLMISVSVRVFAYGGYQNDLPWLPYQGLASTTECRVAPHYAAYVSTPILTDTELQLTWSGVEYETWIHSDTDILRMRHLYVEWGDVDTDTYLREDLLLDPYDARILSDHSIHVPLTAMDADVLIAIVRRLSTGGIAPRLLDDSDMSVISQYGARPPQYYDSYIAMDPTGGGASSFTPTPTDARFWTTIPSADATHPITHAYQRVMTERGPHLVEIPVPASSSTSRIALWADGTSLDPSKSRRAWLVFARDTGTQALSYAAGISSCDIPMSLTSLSWQTSDGLIHLILLAGNLSFSYGRARDVASAIRRGGKRYLAAASGTESPSLKFSGTVYGAAASIASTSDVIVHDSIDDLYRIPDDDPVRLRSSYGTTYSVLITSISSPRNVAGLADITIEMLEVEDS